MVRALALHADEPGSNPVLISGVDLFPVVPDSVLPRFVFSQLVASFQFGFGNHVSGARKKRPTKKRECGLLYSPSLRIVACNVMRLIF